MPPAIPSKATHEQWRGLVQPVGLVVAPAVLIKLELFPHQGTAYLAARQRQLEALLATELLDWGDADLQCAAQLQVVPKLEGEGSQALELDRIGPTQRVLKALGGGALSTPGRRRLVKREELLAAGRNPIEQPQGKKKPATAPPHAAAG